MKGEVFLTRSGSSEISKLWDKDGEMYIKKKIYRKPEEKFKRESEALYCLEKYDRFPKIIRSDPKEFILYLTYCGENINLRNIPTDWNRHINEIRKCLEETDIVNGDINEKNLCVMDNRIYLIDFGNIRLRTDKFFKSNDFDKYRNFQHNKLKIICTIIPHFERNFN